MFANKFTIKSRVLITGVTSIHGYPIYLKLKTLFNEEQLLAIRPPKMKIPKASNVRSLCITNKEEFQKIQNSFQPTHVIHCAGVCDLDVCEERPKWAEDMNALGAKTIADVFGSSCYITYVSSDLVFSGKDMPQGGYSEESTTDAISVVGKTMVMAENIIKKCPYSLIVRVALPLGDSVTQTKGAIDWIESRFKKRLPVTLFTDEVRSVIDCNLLAESVLSLISTNAKGLFHLGGKDPMSLYEIGEMVLQSGNYPKELLIKSSLKDEIGGPPRISNVTLNSTKCFIHLNRSRQSHN